MRKFYFYSLMCLFAIFFASSLITTPLYGQLALSAQQQLEAEKALMQQGNLTVNFNGTIGTDGILDGECDNALPITSGSITNQPLVCGTEDLLNSTSVGLFCNVDANTGDTISTFYADGFEATYTYTPSEDGTATITVSNTTWAAIFVYEGCPLTGSCVASTRSTLASRTLTFDVTEGVEYFFWIDSWPAPASPCVQGGLLTFTGPEPAEEGGGGSAACNDTDVAITDNAAFTSVINITESGTIGTDANLDSVVMDIQHTFAGDLEIVLISPAGTEVALTTDNGGGTGLDTQSLLTFTDTSTNSVASWDSGAPLADYKAEGGDTTHPVGFGDGSGVNLNDEFAGESITGDWTLRVYDDAGGDTGTLFNFCLNFTADGGGDPGGDPIEECNDSDIAIATNAVAYTSVISINDAGTIGTDATLDSVIAEIQHTWANDLEIILISPAGTEVALSTDNGGGDGLDSQATLTFTDSATNPAGVWNSGAPAASYRAEGGPTAHPVDGAATTGTDGPGVNLNDEFAGESITGNWTMRIWDDLGGDVGTLFNFCLNFTVESGGGGECEWTVTVFDDGLGDEVSWEFRDADGNILLSGGPYITNPYTDAQTISAAEPVEFYIESMGSWNDNTPSFTIENGNGIILSGGIAGGTEATYSDLLCSAIPPPAPANDNCSDVTPTELTNGVPVTFNGTTEGGTASPEEMSVLGYGAVWEAVTLTGDCNNLTVDYCGTPAGNMDGNMFIVYTPDCPVSTFVAGSYDWTTCPDGNGTVRFSNLPAGTYYIPVIIDTSLNTLGDYVMNVIVEECFVIEEPDFDCFQGDGLEGNAEDGYNVSSATAFRTADDFIVADGTSFTMQHISMSVMSTGELTSVDFNILNDNAGQPGALNQTISGVTPTQQNISGSAFGLNIYWVEFDLPAPVELSSGTYWLAPVITTVTNDGAAYWEATSTGTTGGSSYRSENGGATWAIDPDGFNNVFFVAGECEDSADGCFVTGSIEQWPSTTFTPSCIGTPETITTAGWAGEYSKVAVTAGVEYTFSSSISTDFITIADEDEDIAFATGTGSVTWTSSVDQVIRFFTHVDEDCTIEEISRTRSVLCGDVPPPPTNDDCTDAIALSCGDSDSGSTVGANDSGGNAAGDVFYSFTGSGAEEMVTVSLCGSSYDTTLRIFTDCSMTEEVAYNDDSCGLQSEVNFLSDGTSTYYIMVEGYSSNTGNYVINISCMEPPVYDPCAPVHTGVPNSGVGFSNGYSAAVDVNVLANTQFNVSSITLDVVTLGGEPTTFDISFFEGETGVETPFGDTFTGMTPTSMTPNGLLFGLYPIYTVELPLPTTQTFPATESADKKYWISVASGLDDLGNFTYWVATEYTDTNTLPMWQNDGVNWFVYVDDLGANAEGVITIEGECEELGVSDMTAFDFTYYPNPVKDVLNITSNKKVESVSVYNLAGQQVLASAKVNEGQIDVSALSTGVYVFKATLQGGQVETFKIIKK